MSTATQISSRRAESCQHGWNPGSSLLLLRRSIGSPPQPIHGRGAAGARPLLVLVTVKQEGLNMPQTDRGEGKSEGERLKGHQPLCGTDACCFEKPRQGSRPSAAAGKLDTFESFVLFMWRIRGNNGKCTLGRGETPHMIQWLLLGPLAQAATDNLASRSTLWERSPTLTLGSPPCLLYCDPQL